MMGKYIVTIAPPTPNGDLHLGHISGPYMAADIFARLRRQIGDEVVFVSYSDDYQSYVARKARETGANAAELALTNGEKILQSMQMLDIDIDHFQQSGNNQFYLDSVQMFHDGLAGSGDMGAKDQRIPYFPEHDVYGYEAYARGECNVCGELSDASQCENCATSPVLEEMTNIRCTLEPDSELEWRTVTRHYLNLPNKIEFLKRLYAGKLLRPSLRNFMNRIIETEHDHWFINRPGECGAPTRDINGDVTPVHTWFSGIAGYHAAVSEYAQMQNHPELADYFWKDKNTTLSMFVGYDCSFSHAVVYPILLSYQDDLTQSFSIYTNHFLKLNDEDFSTSRGHAIWARDIAGTYDVNAIRLYLASIAPENSVANYRQSEFEAFHEKYFIQGIRLLMEQTTGGDYDIARLLQQHPPLSAALYGWTELNDPDLFSMQKLAGVLLALLDYLLAQDLACMDVGQWTLLLATYGYIGRSVHPGLSNDISAHTGVNDNIVKNLIEKNLVCNAAELQQYA